MSDKFGEFDNYQLAKYNKGGKKKKKVRLARLATVILDEDRYRVY